MKTILSDWKSKESPDIMKRETRALIKGKQRIKMQKPSDNNIRL